MGLCNRGFVDTDRDPETGCECRLSNDGDEACDGSDNDCDGLVDEAFDFNNNPNHCGVCNRRCVLNNAVSRCAMRQCEVVGCEDGWADVDGLNDTGCEHDCTANPAPDECGGAPVDFDYVGTYDLVPKIRYSCAFPGLGEILNIDVGRVVFAEPVVNDSQELTGTAQLGRTELGGGREPVEWCTDPAAPPQRACLGAHTNDGRFRLQRIFAGDCTETWSLIGEFDDADNWSGTLAVTFAGFTCDFTTCRNQSYDVTGRRL